MEVTSRQNVEQLGSWKREGANANRSPLSNQVVNVSRDTTVKDVVLGEVNRVLATSADLNMKDSDQAESKSDTDPVIEAYKEHIDRTLIRENLRLTVDQRFQQLMRLQRFAEELQNAGRKARQK